VSSFYELSKAATEASSATVNFYNASLQTDENFTEIYAKLAESLELLTSASQGISSVAHSVVHDSYIPSIGGAHPAFNGALIDGVKLKKKVEKDPNAPKKPLTVFFAYSAYSREALKEDREARGLPPLSSTEITQEISKKWNELSDEEKEKWKEAYNKELETYHGVKEKYLEAKKNGEDVTIIGPNPAPVPIPEYLKQKSSKRSHDGEKKEKKKKSKKRKSEHAAAAVEPSLV
jgi:hypothetical protein